MLRVAIEGEGGRYRAAGMLVQHLSEGEEGRERLHVKFDHPEWEHVAHLAGSIRHEELLDGNLSMEALVWRLFHEEEEVRMLAGTDLFRGCRCSKTHYEEVLLRFPCAERDDMRDEDGVIRVDCAFCSRQFEVAA
jgi:molecular chaperone Hsp33